MDGPGRLLVTLLLGTLPLTALAEPCPGVPFEVETVSQADHASACDAAAQVLPELARLGLKPIAPMGLTIVGDHFEPPYHRILALYRIRTGRIELLASRVLREEGDVTVLGLPFSDCLYRSLVVHEIAHAVASMHGSDGMGLAAQEYIAFALQIASLPAAERERIVAQAGVAGFGSLGEVSEIYLLLDPQRFAVKAYLQFAASADPAALLQHLLQLGSSTM